MFRFVQSVYQAMIPYARAKDIALRADIGHMSHPGVATAGAILQAIQGNFQRILEFSVAT